MAEETPWSDSEILEAVLYALEHARQLVGIPQLSENTISAVAQEETETPVLMLALENGQEFEIVCKTVASPTETTTPEAIDEGDLVKRTVLVQSEHIAQLAEVLTGYGEILGIDHEGTISFSVEGEDVFELGRQVSEIEGTLRSYDTGVAIVSAKKPVTKKK